MTVQIKFELLTAYGDDRDQPCGACESMVLAHEPAVKYEIKASGAQGIQGFLHVDCAPPFVRKKFGELIERCERTIKKDQCPSYGGCSACPIAEEMTEARVVFKG